MLTINSVKILHAVASAITAIAELLVYFLSNNVSVQSICDDDDNSSSNRKNNNVYRFYRCHHKPMVATGPIGLKYLILIPSLPATTSLNFQISNAKVTQVSLSTD